MSNRTIWEETLIRVIERQGHQCAYCTLPFGSVIYIPKQGEIITTAVADHWIPWAQGGGSIEQNCIAACEPCNRLKNDRIYDDLQSASRDILIRKMKHKHVTMFIPETPSTMDYVAWQSEYLDWYRSS
jgi:5-methylcytosine-specific restriction endonuclease McrA